MLIALASAACSDAGPDREPAAAPVCELPANEDASAPSGMVFVTGGEFTQGAAPLHDEEGPPRRTKVDGFWIDRTEVTNDQFAKFIAATGYVTISERPLDPKAYPGLAPDQLRPSSIVFVGVEGIQDNSWWRVVAGADWRHPEGPESSLAGRSSHPVVHIAYEDALAYARWLGRDLPTEAEWEYAARGGLDGSAYTWGDAPLDREKPQANVWQGVFPFSDDGKDGYKARTSPVGCFAPNGYGLYDMAGNVWEWTKDWYRPALDPADGVNPSGPDEQQAQAVDGSGEKNHVIKGGSFLCADNFCLRYRPPAREAGPSDSGSSHVGFRTVLRSAR